MSAQSLLQFVSQVLFVLVFIVTLVRAVRWPWKANIDVALLFGVLAILVIEQWVAAEFHLSQGAVIYVVTSTLLMALPYLLLRLVDDFAGVARPLRLTAEAGLAAAVVGLIVTPSNHMPAWLALLYVAYFVGFVMYAALRFARATRASRGVTQRRMQAVAAGSAALGLVLVVAGAQVLAPAAATLWSVIAQLWALLCGLAYFVGFAPPSWLKRAWQEPELRAFLGRAAHLPRLPTTQSIVQELERGAANALGAPHAAILLWDESANMLHSGVDGVEYARPVGELLAGQVFTAQRAMFWPDTTRADPQHAKLYRIHEATALLAAPISAGEKRLGVLVVYAARAPIFADDDLILVRLLADQAAVILESRALIDEATRVRAREEATRLKDDFLSAAAHDLKTPLTTLIAQAQLMQRRAEKNPMAPADLQGIERMVGEAQRLKRLVLDVLDVARLEQGKLVGHRESADLVALAREVCERHTSPHHRCTLDARAAVIGEYDAGRIMQLLDNLLDNAIKYSPHADEVNVRIWQDGDEAHIAVTDHGIGIPARDLPQLFDRFHRGANVDDRQFAGMGLGLFICRGIAEQHGGHISATSPGPGQGSTFHVVLPAAQPHKDTAEYDDSTMTNLRAVETHDMQDTVLVSET